MKIDVLVAEIGSTTTVLNAFSGIGSARPLFLGQGAAPTSVSEGDVTIGIENALKGLRENLKEDKITWEAMLATSSAAGGLRMSVHGLVYDMTVKAATEAALGAGAIIKNVTAGKLRRSDIKQILELSPNLILVAGGVDYGERDTALHNYEMITEHCPDIPVIFAGNIQNQEDVRLISEERGTKVYIVDNVYPKLDLLNVEPTRKVIHDAFEDHIIHAPGMSTVRSMVTGPIIPTPGSVMECAKMLYTELSDLIVFDVGGATTDLHSVTPGTEEIQRILISPEPDAKRTVEGDLGVYVNMHHIVEKVGEVEMERREPDFRRLLTETGPIPKTTEQIRFVETLTKIAVHTALERHAGQLRDLYGAGGKKTYATGKDLTAVRYIIGTGGALTRLPARVSILESVRADANSMSLYPGKSAKVLVDNDYIFASLGVLSKEYPEASMRLARQSLGID